jgi:beta-xylosidase
MKMLSALLCLITVVLLAAARAGAEGSIDEATVKAWSAELRGWHYWPDHVIGSEPNIPGFPELHMTDCPTVFQLPGDEKWYMSFIGFDGRGYQSFVAESDDLVYWSNYRLAFGFGPEGSFDHGGRVLGAYLYESYDLAAPRVLKRLDGHFWTLYGAYPLQGGYELRPGYEGVAISDDGLTWQRAQEAPILSVYDVTCGEWEQSCIYQPWLVEAHGRYFNFYNAASGGIEQTGLATSQDLLNWRRYTANPIARNTPGGYDEAFCSDPKVYRDGDHWVMFYFGVGKGGAHIMVAFSRDLYHWTKDPEPLYLAGGNPSGLDRQYAHKTSIVWNPKNETWYLFYNAVGDQGRGIGLITSKAL